MGSKRSCFPFSYKQDVDERGVSERKTTVHNASLVLTRLIVARKVNACSVSGMLAPVPGMYIKCHKS